MIRSVPIYDYRCDHCGHVFSAVRSFTEADVDSCPNCGKRPRKLITAPAVVFKGSGWYKTDSRGAAPKEGDSTTKTETKTETKTDATAAKPETKTEAKPASTAPKTSGDGKSSEAKS